MVLKIIAALSLVTLAMSAVVPALKEAQAEDEAVFIETGDEFEGGSGNTIIS